VIIVDTSVWIDFFRQPDSQESEVLYSLIDQDRVVGLSAIFGELLQGAKNEAEEKLILDIWDAVPKIDESKLFIDAGILSFREKLVTKGIGLIDCLILAAAKRNHLTIWTLDKKLERESDRLLK
jgi:Predicted nucleic acid-binding protein, contains PIN domain